jgi:RNA polymerase sigma-70 factor, ECF subfamily
MSSNPSVNFGPESGQASVSQRERRLIAGVLAKERKATAEFVELCSDWIYGFVRGRLPYGSEHLEDLMQEVLVAAWQALPQFREESGLRGWVLGIARHKIEDYYRKRIRECDLPQDDEDPEEPAVVPLLEQKLDSALEEERVQKILAELPESYSLALMWRYRDEKSAREMAQMSGKTEKAMERLLARARESFRKRWNYGRP